MRGHELEEKFGKKAREYEVLAEQLEQDVARLDRKRTMATQRLADALRGLAEIQIENGDYSHSVGDELAKRAREEESTHTNLQSVESHIAEVSRFVSTQRKIVDKLEDRAAEALAQSADWNNTVSLIRELTKHNSLEQHAELQRECTKKIAGYSDDVFLSYLRRQGYGMPGYAKTGLIRVLDGWLASNTNFKQNLENLGLLESMLAASLESERSLKPRLRALLDKQETLSRVVAEEVGLTAAEEELAKLVGRLDGLKAKANGLHTALNEFAAKRDASYRGIVAQMKARLGNTSIETLMDRAALTTCVKDDRLVDEISKARATIKEVEPELTLQSERLTMAKAKYEKAKEAQRHARQQIRRHDGRRYNNNLDVDSMITGYVLGSVALGDISKTMTRGSYMPAEEPSSSSSSFGGSGFGSSDSFGGSGFSSSSSFGGGGFSTTDSF